MQLSSYGSAMTNPYAQLSQSAVQLQQTTTEDQAEYPIAAMVSQSNTAQGEAQLHFKDDTNSSNGGIEQQTVCKISLVFNSFGECS
jgi:hypothetical protein